MVDELVFDKMVTDFGRAAVSEAEQETRARETLQRLKRIPFDEWGNQVQDRFDNYVYFMTHANLGGERPVAVEAMWVGQVYNSCGIIRSGSYRIDINYGALEISGSDVSQFYSSLCRYFKAKNPAPKLTRSVWPIEPF